MNDENRCPVCMAPEAMEDWQIYTCGAHYVDDCDGIAYSCAVYTVEKLRGDIEAAKLERNNAEAKAIAIEQERDAMKSAAVEDKRRIAEMDGRLKRINKIVSVFRVTDHSIDIEWVKLRDILTEGAS